MWRDADECDDDDVISFFIEPSTAYNRVVSHPAFVDAVVRPTILYALDNNRSATIRVDRCFIDYVHSIGGDVRFLDALWKAAYDGNAYPHCRPPNNGDDDDDEPSNGDGEDDDAGDAFAVGASPADVAQSMQRSEEERAMRSINSVDESSAAIALQRSLYRVEQERAFWS